MNEYWRLQEKLNAVSMALWGIDGQNGLASKARDTEKRLTVVETRLTQYDQTQVQIRAVWATVRWIGLGVAAMIGFATTTPVASFITNILRAGAGP